jgi:choline dehydrogenase-like flavoprotein
VTLNSRQRASLNGYSLRLQEGLFGRRIGHAQGKALGGSSAINAQALIPFSSADLDDWENLVGNSGWNASLLSSLDQVFSLRLPDADTMQHLNVSWAGSLAASSTGLVNASFAGVKQDPIPKAWDDTFKNLGYPLTASPFSGHSTGAYNAPSTVHATTKTRSYSGNSYYLPVANRSNLVIYTHSIATRILLDGDEQTATGVEFLQANTNKKANVIKTINANKEIILSAGAFNSPKLLELSGIGDPDVLRSAGVEVKVSNPHIGTNLQDHILCAVSFEAMEGILTGDDLMRNDPEALKQAMALYQEHQAGPFASPGISSFGYLPTVDFIDDTQARDVLLESLSKMESSHPLDQARIDQVHRLLREGDEGTGQYFIFPAQSAEGGRDTISGAARNPKPGNFITMVVALSHPLSTGTVHITTSDVATPPTVDPRYLTNDIDLELHARHVRYLETIAATAPMSSILKPDGKRNDDRAFFAGSLEKAKEFAKLASTTNWHSVGTCAMAPKEKGGVVDDNLRVYGVRGLRVVDASVFPLVPQSNTQSLVYAVAERASKLIAGSWGNGV